MYSPLLQFFGFNTSSVGGLLRSRSLLLVFALALFVVSHTAQAVDPPPDGGYPNNNTAEGTDALFQLAGGFDNTAIGFDALFSNTAGSSNTAVGSFALQSNTTGIDNTANGSFALLENTTGDANTANGIAALQSNTTGNSNTATGTVALANNTSGSDNTANGGFALQSNTTGIANTANGFQALLKNTTGIENTAHGSNALSNNTTASCSTANGYDALRSNTTGGRNTATGWGALELNTTGGHNTANGFEALFANKTGGNNIALGYLAGHNLTTGSNNIDIGNQGVAAEGKTIRIGTKVTHTNTYIAGISGVTVAGGIGVIIDTNGHRGTVVSSARFKEAIKPMDKASEAILALQPVTFRYKHEIDPDGIPQFGLVAEQVEKVNPDLVARDADGKVNTVRYEAVNAMLLNEFLKQHRIVQEQQAPIAFLKNKFESTVAQQQKQIEALIATVQKVSDQIALSKPTPQLVANP
jgi:trimeric autotransporter adhesin